MSSIYELYAVDIWKDTTVDKLEPEDTVYAVTCVHDMITGAKELIFDIGFKTPESAKTFCFWFQEKDLRPKLIKMSAKDFVKMHVEKVPAMNPFFELGRLQFLTKWYDKIFN